jgi:ABC-2 type transport system ATP-binding protein
MTNAIEMRNVVKRYGKHTALNGFDLDVPAGSVFGLVGSNGAGKTTSMAVCAGLLGHQSGTVNLLGDGPFDAAKHGGRIALLPQDSRLPLHAKIEDLLVFYGNLQGMKGSSLENSINEVLEWVHLRDRRASPIRTLSHGMARRVTIAQAFLGEPDLVFLDEPLSGLDPREVARIRPLLAQRRGRQTIVISSHNLHEIEALCDHVAFIEAGRRVSQDTITAMTRRSHRVTYKIGQSQITAERLAELVPEARWEVSADRRALTAYFTESSGTLAGFNARVVPVLLAENVPIEEIQRGSDLETEYLAATAHVLR